MKIDKPGKTAAVTPLWEGGGRSQSARTAENTSTPTPSPTSPQVPGTNVQLGGAASQLQALQNTAAGTPVVDARKVAEIKQAISEGRFQVDAGAVADGLISSVRNLISARQVGG